jgi:thioredoxin-like negative regulator of GroEL
MLSFSVMAIPSISSFSEFEEVLKQDQDVLFFFSSAWLEPCKAVRAALEKCVPKFPSVYFVEVDYDNNFDIVDYCNVRSVPAFRSFQPERGRKFVDWEGSITPSKLENLIRDRLK